MTFHFYGDDVHLVRQQPHTLLISAQGAHTCFIAHPENITLSRHTCEWGHDVFIIWLN